MANLKIPMSARAGPPYHHFSQVWLRLDIILDNLLTANRELWLSLCQCFNEKGKVLNYFILNYMRREVFWSNSVRLMGELVYIHHKQLKSLSPTLYAFCISE